MSFTRGVVFPSRHVSPERIVAVLQIFGVAAALAAIAPVAIPVPGLPAPLTLQTLLVGSAGLLVGPNRAATGVALWILWGMLGAPVWAGAQGGLEMMLSIRGGYLLAMPVAAFLCGWLRTTSLPRIAIFLAGSLVVLLGGAVGCLMLTGWHAALSVAIVPYLGVEALKGIMGHFAVALVDHARAGTCRLKK